MSKSTTYTIHIWLEHRTSKILGSTGLWRLLTDPLRICNCRNLWIPDFWLFELLTSGSLRQYLIWLAGKHFFMLLLIFFYFYLFFCWFHLIFFFFFFFELATNYYNMHSSVHTVSTTHARTNQAEGDRVLSTTPKGNKHTLTPAPPQPSWPAGAAEDSAPCMSNPFPGDKGQLVGSGSDLHAALHSYNIHTHFHPGLKISNFASFSLGCPARCRCQIHVEAMEGRMVGWSVLVGLLSGWGCWWSVIWWFCASVSVDDRFHCLCPWW